MNSMNQFINSAFANTSHIIPFSFWAISIVVLMFTSVAGLLFYKHSAHAAYSRGMVRGALKYIVDVVTRPLIALVFCYALYALITIYQYYFPHLNFILNKINLSTVLGVLELMVFFWLILRALSLGKARITSWALKTNNKTLLFLMPAIGSSLQASLFLLMVTILIPELHLHGLAGLFLEKISKVLLISIMAWIFVQIVNVLEKFIVSQYITENMNHYAARKINTQVSILKRVIIAIGMVVAIASILMVFDSVKNVGAGLLTTAGIISAVGAFASQQSLGRIFAGLQIAFTQPIRIGDTVIIENEFGQVEEITLSYIVIKLWDLRRLILPTDYFTSKGLQNLTRESSELLGTIFLYTDYSLPVARVRDKFAELVQKSKFWDGKVAALQVTDLKESSMELRALVSAKDASVLWSLRCEIREQLIDYIVQTFPNCLSKGKNIVIALDKQKTSQAITQQQNVGHS
jgi:small-conductance mechanosensitive channel